jgi:AraC family transcriptional regulator, transcriptional activator of the genes for pyochelin and ferripyochelin receptors
MIDLYIQQQSRFSTCHDRCFPLPEACGSGYFRSVSPRQGMLLFIEEYQLRRELAVTTSNMLLPLGLSYCLSGRVNWTMAGRREQFITRRGECELLLAGRTNGRAIYGADEPVVTINIMLCPGLLQSYFETPVERPDKVDIPGLPVSGDHFLHRKGAIPEYIQSILKHLMRSPCRRAADKLLIQSKVMELVAFQLDQLDPSDRTADAGRDKPVDHAMISRAKSILRSRMQSPPSLKSLARLVGTNETKLKKCFSAVCGTTVYGYLTACRMQRACELLEDHGMTMSQIGFELGYSERTHFSRAFSRYYGIAPSQYRQRCLLPPK